MDRLLIIFIILIKLSSSLYTLKDELFGEIQYNSITILNCSFVDINNFYFRGRLPNIVDILNKENKSISNNSEIEGYKYVYIPENPIHSEYVKYFSNSTIFLLIIIFKNIKLIMEIIVIVYWIYQMKLLLINHLFIII